jgi:2-polyprenyl-6-methoxyphenol hydroxylase-like FAD-dependent oxidoreductase
MVSLPRNALPIAIAGGGIGGLACALALAQRNFGVVVLEQASQFGEVGVGLQVAPNALSVLDALGVGAEVKRDALMIERLLLMDAIDNKVVCDIPCDDGFTESFGNGYAVAHRADVHGALLRACQREPLVQLRTDHHVLDFTQDGVSVRAEVEGGKAFTAAALIGADGLRSRVRQRLVGDGEAPRAPAIIYRALVPAEAMPKAYKHPFPRLWVGPGAHLIYYPVRDWSFFNVAATTSAPCDACCEGEVSADEVLKSFPGWSGEPLAVLRTPARYQRFAIRYRDPIESWTSGLVTLLGDAAHPMVQYIAQGAAMALEDAICLADRVDELDGDLASAFKAYEQIRIVRSARVQLSSLMLDRLYHADGVERLVRNAMFEGRTASQYNDRLSWLFSAPPYVQNRCTSR